MYEGLKHAPQRISGWILEPLVSFESMHLYLSFASMCAHSKSSVNVQTTALMVYMLFGLDH